MNISEAIVSALQGLKSNIVRTGLTMLGIIIGISSVILIVSIGQGAVAFITDELSSFGTNYFAINPGSDAISSIAGGVETLTLEDAEAIRDDSSLTNISYVAPGAAVSAAVSANGVEKNLLIYGVTPEIVEIFKPAILQGEFLTTDHNAERERVAVLGAETMETFFGIDAEPVGETIRINDHLYRVVGIARSDSTLAGGVFNRTIYIPIEVMFDELTGTDALQEIDIGVYNADFLNQTIEDVEALLRDRHSIGPDDEDDFTISSSQDILSTVETITTLLTLMIAAISGISLVVGGVGVMNIMLVSVAERTKEVGLLKSLGARDRDILLQFLIESIVMTLIGGIVGILWGISGAFLLAYLFKIPFVVSIPAVIVAVCVSLGVGLLFGLYPARRAARLSPIEALRYE